MDVDHEFTAQWGSDGLQETLMGIAMLYKDEQKVFFKWITEDDRVWITGSGARKHVMRKSEAREHWKGLRALGFKRAFE